MNDPNIVSCCECDEQMIDLRKQNSYWQAVEGWERKRIQGGQNHVALRKPIQKFMCLTCMGKMQRGFGSGQVSLV